MQLTTNSIIIVVIAVIALVAIISFFLSGSDQDLDETRTFAEGCVLYCDDIEREAESSNEALELVAIRRASELQDSNFIRACNKLYPETERHPYLCWNRGCCFFDLPPP